MSQARNLVTFLYTSSMIQQIRWDRSGIYRTDGEINIRRKTTKRYDGTVDRFMRDNDGMHFAAFIQCKEAFGDQQVYCHKVHIQHIQSGDKVCATASNLLKRLREVEYRENQ